MRDDERRAVIEAAVTHMLTALDGNPNRQGLQETPTRVAKSLLALCVPQPFEFTTFDAEDMDEMMVQGPIPFYSLCEHHMLPFFGVATVAYIPGKKIVGLSKLTRAVQYCAAGLQNQERITTSITKMLMTHLECADVAAVLRARHLCMEMRGVRAAGVYSTSSSLRGSFRDDASTRAEFYRHLAGNEK